MFMVVSYDYIINGVPPGLILFLKAQSITLLFLHFPSQETVGYARCPHNCKSLYEAIGSKLPYRVSNQHNNDANTHRRRSVALGNVQTIGVYTTELAIA